MFNLPPQLQPLVVPGSAGAGHVLSGCGRHVLLSCPPAAGDAFLAVFGKAALQRPLNGEILI